MTRLARGSYTSLVVRLGDIDTNKWAPLLRLRDSLVAAEETDSSDHAHSDNRPGAAPLERPRAGAREEHDAASTTARAPGDTVHRITNPRNRPLSSQSREQIRRLADSGLSAPEVAMRHGVHEGTVRAIWREQHRPRRQGWRRFSDEDRQRAEQMVSQGMTLIEVGLALGFDRGTVRKHIRDRTHH